MERAACYDAGMKGMIYKLVWFRKGDGVMVKEEQYEMVVEERMVCDGVMTVVVVFCRWCAEVDLWAIALQNGSYRKQSSYNELKCEWDMHSTGDLVICLGDLN